ncbi:LysR family transcriptional regulator [Actinacidiphila rubida]|uniref:Transcriptional regulator, LysR family n=1 Tax=Actinacidiphila rubida TaxID=310780 RepID=A0A1H8DDI1_9ACTN|nr:LysR substrate-binding domain-containing protein [Actinacidiphila rubida]SEN05342.1 transcriptional regulator, LysR family [Actinacidiphila rubida]
MQEPLLDLRKVRYFVAVAERLHFGRAALDLRISQPALSRQVRQLEHDLGTDLFVRTSREVALTPAGEQLLHDGHQLLAAAHRARERARRAGGQDRLTVGFMLGVRLDPLLEAFGGAHPEAAVRLERLRWWNHGEAPRDGRVDVGVIRLPVRSAEGLRMLTLGQERLVAAVPAEHPLAGRPSVPITAFADEPVLRYADAGPAWNAFWTVDPRPDGTRPAAGPEVRDMEEILAYVRAGSGVAFLPETVSAAFARPHIAYVPVSGVPAGTVVLAWPVARPTELTRAFVDTVRAFTQP